ncbi:cellulose biosynthesis protein BcsO [Pectobacteriaceae bacterium CE90]|nr:cellulose biosynthesis protein BcsO [Pectobacteriaceae bacterium CE90]
MKSYDDMQRFKDKAQIKDINFKEITRPLFQSEASGWPIIKHFLGSQKNEDASLPDQLINITQPMFIGADSVSTKAFSPVKRVEPPIPDEHRSLIHSIAAMLPQTKPSPATGMANKRVVDIAPADSVVKTSPGSVDAPVQATPDADRFRHLFTVRAQNDHQSQPSSKAMLLKPLLEKIASCH